MLFYLSEFRKPLSTNVLVFASLRQPLSQSFGGFTRYDLFSNLRYDRRKDNTRAVRGTEVPHNDGREISPCARVRAIVPSSIQFRKGWDQSSSDKLTAQDLYDVTFSRARGIKIFYQSKVDGLYCDQLREAFTEATGLEVALHDGRMEGASFRDTSDSTVEVGYRGPREVE